MKKQSARSAKKSTGTPKKTPRPKEVELVVDRNLALAWKRTLSELEASNLEGSRAWDRKYEAVGAILGHDPPLYLAGGVATAAAFVAKYLPGETIRSVVRSVRVAQYASPDEEAKYGTSKIDEAIDYLEAKHGKPARGRIPVDFARLRIDTKTGSVSFGDASVEQIRTATRLLATNAGAKKPKKESPNVAAIRKKLPSNAREVSVHYANGYVSLGRIPVAQFAKILRALASAALVADPT